MKFTQIPKGSIKGTSYTGKPGKGTRAGVQEVGIRYQVKPWKPSKHRKGKKP